MLGVMETRVFSYFFSLYLNCRNDEQQKQQQVNSKQIRKKRERGKKKKNIKKSGKDVRYIKNCKYIFRIRLFKRKCPLFPRY